MSPGAVTEGGDATFTISSASPVSQAVTVAYKLSGKARLGSDYTLSGTAGQATIPAGSASVAVTVHSIADHVSEKKETVIITLSSGPGYKLSKAKKATLNILNGP